MPGWTLRPNDTVSHNTTLTGGSTVHGILADNSDSSYVAASNNTDATIVVRLDDLPSDFGSMTSIGLDFRLRGSGLRVDDNYAVFAQLFADDALTTPLTNEVQVAAWGNINTLSFTTVSGAATIQGTPTQTQWNSAVLRIRLDHQQTMSADGITMQVAEAYVNIVYALPPAPTDTPTLSLQSSSTTSLGMDSSAVGGAQTYEFQRNSVTIQNTASQTFNDTGLTPGTSYDYRVRGVNSTGPGPWSSVSTYKTITEVPGNRSVTPLSSTELEVDWDSVAGATSYDLRNADTLVGIINAQTPTFYTHTGRQPGTQYNYNVRSRGGALPGDWSPTFSGLTLPDVPSGYAGTPISQSQIDVSWNAATSATGYDLRDATTLTVLVNNQNVLSFSHTGLNPSTEYFYQVRARNASGVGAWSPAFSATTFAPMLEVPFAMWNGSAWVEVVPSVKT